MEQRKTESINQFAGRVEQCFKQLCALYPGRYDCSQLKEWIFQGMHPHLRDPYVVPIYEGGCRI